MNRRKSNISAWCLLALVSVGCLVMSVGVAFARYREDVSGDVQIGARENAQVYLVAGNDPENDSPGAAEWEESSTGSEMRFMITNTGEDDAIPEADQTCTLRLAASLDVWDGESEINVSLTYTQENRAEMLQTQISRIQPDTMLYRQFGDGWLITFVDGDGDEMVWTLEGKQRSAISMQLVLETEQSIDEGMIKLQLEGRMKAK